MPNVFANPYLLAGSALLIVMTHGLAYFQGRSDGAAAVQARYARAAEKALQAMRRSEHVIDALNGAHARARSQQDSENRSIRDAAKPILTRSIYTVICVDADGVGLLDRARAVANGASDPSEPAGAADGTAGVSAQ